jgi:predicted dienelactone hydrolase
VTDSSRTQVGANEERRLLARFDVRRIIRALVLLLALCTVAILAAAAFGWVRHNRPVTLPQPAGSYAIGRVAFDWVDPNRRELFGKDPSAHRELLVWAWYPAAPPAPADRPAPYLPKEWRRAMERSRGLAAVLFTQNLAVVQAHALAGAPPAANACPCPVIVMQPGLGPIASDYTTLAEDLASRGYAVFAGTPPYSANAVAYPDGRVVERSDAGTVPDAVPPAEAKAMLDGLVQVWAADNIFIMGRLQALNAADPSGRFTGKLDLGALGVMGHSFGGASAAQTCRLDARCRAGADLDGWPYGDVVQAGLRRPFLFMWSEPSSPRSEGQRQADQDMQTLIRHTTGKTYQLTIPSMRHFNFADYAVLYEPLLRPMQALGPIDGRRGLEITTAYVAAFFDRYLRGMPATLLAGPSPEYPEVQFATH